MKLLRKITLFILVAAAVIAVSGCSGLLGWIMPFSIEERIVAFSLVLNAEDRNPDEILLNFGPQLSMEQYDNAKTTAYWEDAFPSEQTYSFLTEGLDTSDPEAVKVDAIITTESGGLLYTTYLFKMHEELSGNFLINAIYEDPDGTNEMLIRKADFTE